MSPRNYVYYIDTERRYGLLIDRHIRLDSKVRRGRNSTRNLATGDYVPAGEAPTAVPGRSGPGPRLGVPPSGTRGPGAVAGVL